MGQVVSEHLVSVVVAPVGSAGLGGQLDRDVHVHHLQHLLGLGVNLNNIVLFKSRDFWDVVVSSLPLFLLKLDRDTTNSASLQPLHQVSDEPAILFLRGFEGTRATSSTILLFVSKSRVSLVVLLDNQARSLLHGFGSHLTHFRVSCRSESSN